MSATVASAKPRPLAGLMLLIFAILLPIGGWVYTDIVQLGRPPANLLAYSGAFIAIFAATHLAMRRFAPYADPLILPVVTMLNGLGLVMIHRIDNGRLVAAAQAGKDAPTAMAITQMGWVGLSLILFIAVLFFLRDHRQLQKYTYTSLIVGVILLELPLIPGLGEEINGARNWVSLGPISGQPSEAAKLLLLMFFAGYLASAREILTLGGAKVLGVRLPHGRTLSPLIVALVVGLGTFVFQTDLGMAVLFFGSFFVLLYAATGQRLWIFLGGVLILIGGALGYLAFGHVRTRIDNWIDPFHDPNGASFQLVQSLYAFANGGMIGTGLGQGLAGQPSTTPGRVPFAESDFIMTVVGEELGLAGITAVLLLFAILIERGLRTSLIARDDFGKLLTIGLSVMFALQLFVTVGGISRLIPSTGLTTPFFSLGGSSLVANYLLVALLVRISDGARRPAPTPVGFAHLSTTTAGTISDTAPPAQLEEPRPEQDKRHDPVEQTQAAHSPAPPGQERQAGQPESTQKRSSDE